MLTLSAPKPWFPSSLCSAQSAPSPVPAADGDKRYLLFEGIVLGFFVRIHYLGYPSLDLYCCEFWENFPVPDGTRRSVWKLAGYFNPCEHKFKSFDERWDWEEMFVHSGPVISHSSVAEALQDSRPNRKAAAAFLAEWHTPNRRLGKSGNIIWAWVGK